MDREKMIGELTQMVGKENILSSETDLFLYGYDASLVKAKPDCIVLPGSTDDVSRVVKFAHQNGIPVIPRGSGTNLSGGTVALQGRNRPPLLQNEPDTRDRHRKSEGRG